MKPHIVLWLAPLFLAGCNVPAWGNLFVLCITLALFCATLTLGRHITPTNEDVVPPADSDTVQS
jgi:hypothetical protein